MSSNKKENAEVKNQTDTENATSTSGKTTKAEDSPISVPDTSSGLNLSALQEYLTEKLGLLGLGDREEEKTLDDTTLDNIVEYIHKKKCKNIITMAGAGISTSAGLPDFRSKGTGLYHNLEKYNLPCPEAIFELNFFYANPKPFFVLAKELYPGCFKPTLCHYFIRLLNDKGMLLRHYTQNIDTLERVAEIPEEKLVEAHGTFYTGHCLECHKQYDLEWMKERIFKDEIPICETCPGVVKPDIVFFGENLPDEYHDSVETDFAKCDLLIILGSSLVVHPFADLVYLPSPKTPRLLINNEKVGQGRGLQYDKKGNTRDVAWIGDCDEGCQLLADKLGWGDELRALVKTEHDKIDKKDKGKKSQEEAEKKEAKH